MSRVGDAWYLSHSVFDGNSYSTRYANGVHDERENPLLSWSEAAGNHDDTPPRPGFWDRAQAAARPALIDLVFGGTNEMTRATHRYWWNYIGGAAFGLNAGELSVGITDTAAPLVATAIRVWFTHRNAGYNATGAKVHTGLSEARVYPS